MELSESLVCECNARSYPSVKHLNAHKKTKLHMLWCKEREVFDLRCLCKKLENENVILKNTIKIFMN